MISTFLGQPTEYWLALQEYAEKEGLKPDLLKEIYHLRAKVSFYESRIDQMVKVKEEK